MKIQLTESPSENGYIESLINAYIRSGHTVFCGVSNFYYSNQIPDILHIHWPEGLYKWYAPQKIEKVDLVKIIEERLIWYKKNNTVILYTVHNLMPHEIESEIDCKIFELIINYADVLIHHCNKSIGLLSEIFPVSEDKNNIVCTHGDYLIHHKELDKLAARAEYKLSRDSVVILNFGKQRPYKNEDFIKSVFNRLSVKNKYLVIAGQFEIRNNRLGPRLLYKVRNKIRQNVQHNNIKYLYRHFMNNEIPGIISCADIVFLGQQNALNSGVLALSATYGKPVVYPNIGCFQELMTGWYSEAYDAGDISDGVRALERMCERIIALDCESKKKMQENWLMKNSWNNHVGNILNNI